jgi:hypothetical protein
MSEYWNGPGCYLTFYDLDKETRRQETRRFFSLSPCVFDRFHTLPVSLSPFYA